MVPEDGLSRLASALAGQGLSRRGYLKASAAVLGTAAVAGWLADSPAAVASSTSAGALPAGLTGTLSDIKHVVVLMQENRSFDHYYGMLPGVRNFADKQALIFPNGQDVFHQPDPSRSDGGVLLPFRLQSGKVNALAMQSLPHGWATDGLPTANDGAWNGWPVHKTQLTMGHFTEDDLPWHYALVNNWTLCDHNHCSFNGSTDPNRIYLSYGMIDPHGTHGGPPQLNNPVTSTLDWPSITDLMQDAGVTWRNYSSGKVESNSGTRTRVIADETVLDDVLAEFIADCANGDLPEVTFINSPGYWQEHPTFTDRGMAFTYRAIQALASNVGLWNSTLFINTYDENDGLFDHVVPPRPEEGTTDEFVNGHSLGPGGRVPMLLVSPWTRHPGGAVCSEVFDHTSITQFLEIWLKQARGRTIRNEFISDWRRTVCGNLLSALDLENPDFSVPDLPDATLLVAAVAADQKLPPAAPPPFGKQAMPVVPADPGTRIKRLVPYAQNATAVVDRAAGTVSVALINDGDSGCSLLVYPEAHLPFRATPYTVVKGKPRTHVWDATATGGEYAMSIYGADRFIRSFAGTVANGAMTLGALPTASSELVTAPTRLLRIHLGNEGLNQVFFTLTPNDYAGTEQTVFVDGGTTTSVDWPVDADGYYDVVIVDSSETGFRHRYAGRVNRTV